MTSFFDRCIFREASHLNGFSGNRIARWSEGRSETSLVEALRAPSTRLLLFREDRALLRLGSGGLVPLYTMAEAEELGLDRDSTILLGVSGGAAILAGSVAAGAAPGEAHKAIDLRSLAMQGALPEHQLAALAQARSYLGWHAANRFCGRCGSPLAMKGGGASRICTGCATEIFPRVDPVVIMLAIDGERCLLGRQPRFEPGRYSALAGFLEPGETIEEAVRREIKEEAGIAVGPVAYHSSQVWPFPSSLMIGCHAEAISTEVARDAAELEDCRWFEREEVMAMMQGSHPDGLSAPQAFAIAHSLIAAFVAWDDRRPDGAPA